MDTKPSLQELYPHLFLNDARSMVSAMLQVDSEAASIKARAQSRNQPPVSSLSLEEKRAIAFACIDSSQKTAKEKQKLDQARNFQKKNLCEYDPRIGIEERHSKVSEMRQNRINKNSAEAQLEELRIKRQKLLEEISPEDLEKVRIEVKKDAEEAKMRDLASKRQIKEMQEKEKVARQKEQLRVEMEKKQRMIMEHRVNRLVKSVVVIIGEERKRILSWAIKKVNEYAIVLRTKMIKIDRKRRFKRMMKGFHLWHSIAFKIKLDEEAAIYQAEQEKMIYLYELAVKSHEFLLKRKALEGIAKNFYMATVEKQQMIEAEKRRKQLENFMSFVKQRTEENERFKRMEMERKEIEEREIMEQMRFEQVESLKREQLSKIIEENESISIVSASEIKSSIKESRRTIDRPTENIKKTEKTSDKQDAATYTEQTSEINSMNISKSDSVSMTEESKTAVQAKPSPETGRKTPKVSKEFLKMQQRQEERRSKRDALEAKYKEKRDKEEQEKKESALKAAEEEKRKKKEIVEKRKQEEKAKKEMEERKKREADDLKEKDIIAKCHYDELIVRRTMAKWSEYHYLWQKNIIKAEVFYDRSIKKYAWDIFKECVAVAKTEKQQLEQKRLEWAYNHYLHVLKRRFFKVIFDNYYNALQRNNDISNVWAKNLCRRVFEGWTDALGQLLDEKYEREKEENAIVERFRFNSVVPKAITAWKEFVQEAKEEKLKDIYTQALWEKAQLWLSEANSTT
jgi:hypothetical protein